MTRISLPLSLAACIRGDAAPFPDWDRIIALANRTWLTPQLFVSLRECGGLSMPPADVRRYLEFIHERNLLRNRRLQQQLREAVAELNASGIAPTLLKGAGDLVEAGGCRLGARMITDLDILVRANETAAAIASLSRLGYSELKNADSKSRVFARPQDAGAIEIHGWPVASRVYASLAGIEACAVRRAFDGLRIRTPPAHLRVLHLVLHDQIKEGDYWRGRIDLRHLYDVARMASGGIDWRALRETARPGLERDALECTLMAAERIFGIDVPPCPDTTRNQAFHHWCQMAQLRHPVAAAPLRLVGDISWICQRIADREMHEWPGWRAAPRALIKGLRSPALAYRALMGVHLGPKT